MWISVKPEHFSKPHSFDKFFKQLERKSLHKVSLHLEEYVVIPVWLVVWLFFSCIISPKIEVYWVFQMKSDYIVCCQRLGLFWMRKSFRNLQNPSKWLKKSMGLYKKIPLVQKLIQSFWFKAPWEGDLYLISSTTVVSIAVYSQEPNLEVLHSVWPGQRKLFPE